MPNHKTRQPIPTISDLELATWMAEHDMARAIAERDRKRAERYTAEELAWFRAPVAL